MIGKHYIGEIGTFVVVDCGRDVSAAVTTEIRVVKPDGTEVVWTAVPYTTNTIAYTVIEGDFDQVGRYALNSYIDTGLWKGHGDTAYFVIYPLE